MEASSFTVAYINLPRFIIERAVPRTVGSGGGLSSWSWTILISNVTETSNPNMKSDNNLVLHLISVPAFTCFKGAFFHQNRSA